jgi:hypothetical protein
MDALAGNRLIELAPDNNSAAIMTSWVLLGARPSSNPQSIHS